MCERRERAAQLRNKESKCQWIRLGERVRQQYRLKECKVVYGWPRCVSMQLEREHTLTRTPVKTRARRLRQQCEHIHDWENCMFSFKKWQEIINIAPKTVSQCSSIKQNLTFVKLEQAKTFLSDVTVVIKALSQGCPAHLVHLSVAYNPVWSQVAQLNKILA